MSFFDVSVFADINSMVAAYLTQHLSLIVNSISLTFIVLAGGFINKNLYVQIRKMHMALRLFCFVLFSLFGYGILGGIMNNLVVNVTTFMGSTWLPAFVVLQYLALGVFAEKMKYGTK